MNGPNPSGRCMCGCGATTAIAQHNDPASGRVKGEHVRFVLGHGRRKSPVPYLVDAETGCWVWQRATAGPKKAQYGTLRINGRLMKAHRFYYAAAHGPIPADLELDHLCANKLCVNPAHLEPVTHQVNCYRAPGTKFSVRDVCAMRWLAALGVERRTIADRFGTSPAYVGHVIHGRYRATVTCPAVDS